jgi:type III secretion protein F
MTDLNTAYTSLVGSVKQSNSNLAEDLAQLTANSGEELNQVDLLNVQFKIGSYNATLELASSIGKGITDMTKTMAQRTS